MWMERSSTKRLVHNGLNMIQAVIEPGSNLQHRRLIQRQYPSSLMRNICHEMYSSMTCDQTIDDISRFFETVLPFSDSSSEPAEMRISELRTRFGLLVLEGHAQLPDLFICTVPWLCLLVADLGKPLIGYFGHPVSFQVRREDQPVFLSDFRDLMLRQEPRTQFIVTDPFLQMQYSYQLGIKLPFIRVSGAYINKELFQRRNDSSGTDRDLSPTNEKYENDILVWDRPYDMALMGVMQGVINELTGPNGTLIDSVDGDGESNTTSGKLRPSRDPLLRFAHNKAYPYRLVTRNALVDRSYKELSKFKALILYPYDMDLVCFYEFYNLGIPIYIPGSIEKYVFYQGHMKYDGRLDYVKDREMIWKHNMSALNETNVDVAMHQLEYADYLALPGVRTFQNITDLLRRLQADGVEERLDQLYFSRQEIDQGKTAWRGVIDQVLGWWLF